MFHVNQIRKENRNAVGTGNLSSTHCKFHNNLNKAYNQSEYRRWLAKYHDNFHNEKDRKYQNSI